MKWPTVLTSEGRGKMLFVKPLKGRIIIAQLRSHRGRGFALSSGILVLLAVVRYEFCTSRCEPSARSLLLAALIKTLTSGMSDRNTASISNESGGDAILRGCLQVCPQGHGDMGRRDALKLWLAPGVKEGLICSAPWGPAQYTTPKWESRSPSFPLSRRPTWAQSLWFHLPRWAPRTRLLGKKLASDIHICYFRLWFWSEEIQ